MYLYNSVLDFRECVHYMVFGILWSAGLVLRTCAYKWISAMTRSMSRSGSEDCCKTMLGMKNNCYINVKVHAF